MEKRVSFKLNPMVQKAGAMESFRNLRTNLIYSSQANVIVLTSTLPNEGKTLNSYYLAISYSLMNKRTLLIDCDLRKGVISRFFTFKKESVKGLSEYLSSQTEDIIYKTDINYLDVIFTGKRPPNPSELLSNGKFQQLIDSYKDQYDYIIIDTPPMSVTMDATIVGRYADGVVLVVRSDFVSKKEAKKVIDRLQSNGCRVLGAVLNRINKAATDYYYSYYGYNYYETE